jgi:hypothetical protein
VSPMFHARPRRVGRLQPREARWFVRGEMALDPIGRPRRRTDWYHVQSLAVTTSWKIRGDKGPLEYKHRVAAGPIEIGGVTGMAEQWAKLRYRDPRPGGEWMAVHKELWRVAGLEVCRVTIDGERWWSVAVSIDGCGDAHLEFGRWSSSVREDGNPGSYPQWLLDRAQVYGSSGAGS